MSISPLQKDLELEVELVEEERRCARVCGAGLAGAVRGLLCSQLRGSSSSWFDPSTKHTHPVYQWNNYGTHMKLMVFSELFACDTIGGIVLHKQRTLGVNIFIED